MEEMLPAVLGRRTAGGSLEGRVEPADRAEAGRVSDVRDLLTRRSKHPLRVRDPMFEQVIAERYAEGLTDDISESNILISKYRWH